jgi:hypothetical protein
MREESKVVVEIGVLIKKDGTTTHTTVTSNKERGHNELTRLPIPSRFQSRLCLAKASMSGV